VHQSMWPNAERLPLLLLLLLAAGLSADLQPASPLLLLLLPMGRGLPQLLQLPPSLDAAQGRLLPASRQQQMQRGQQREQYSSPPRGPEGAQQAKQQQKRWTEEQQRVGGGAGLERALRARQLWMGKGGVEREQ
jgi:hypothetical protein